MITEMKYSLKLIQSSHSSIYSRHSHDYVIQFALVCQALSFSICHSRHKPNYYLRQLIRNHDVKQNFTANYLKRNRKLRY